MTGNDFNDKFWSAKDHGFIISSAIMGAVCYLLIGAWALRQNNPLAMALTILGAAVTDAAWRVMGTEVNQRQFSKIAIALAIASWVIPMVAVGLLVFFRTG